MSSGLQVRHSRRSALRLAPVFALALLASPLSASADGEDDVDVPDYLTLLNHGADLDVEPGWTFDRELQARLDAAIARLGLQSLVQKGKLGVALVDLSQPGAPKLAEVNGTDTVYAASVPKIAVLYAAFQARREGKVALTPTLRQTLTDMCRVSSNTAATAAIDALGFNYINSVLWQSKMYDPETGGGLWLGKSYGGPTAWHRDPIANQSHAASPLALARLLTLLSQDRLVDAESSREMKEILGNPGLNHKFVKGLESRPSEICRKSGTWSLWHGDAALIQRGDKRYVAVALCETPEGQRLLRELIVPLDDCVKGCSGPVTMARAAGATPSVH